MDAAVWGLAGVVIGALLSSILGAWLGHGRWVRGARLDAYAELHAATAQLVDAAPQDADGRAELTKRLTTSNARASVLATKRTMAASIAMASTSLSAKGAPPRSAQHAAFTQAQALFLHRARKDTMRWWTLGR